MGPDAMPSSHSASTEKGLKLTIRHTGKAAAKKLRREGDVPAVVYGRGMDPVSVAFSAKEFIQGAHLSGGPMMSVVMPDGKRARVLVRELRRSPLTGHLEHVDFQRVAAGESVRSEIRILLDDESPLLKKGLVASWVQDHVVVEGSPEDLPERLHIQGGGLDFGDQVVARDLPLPGSIHLLTDPETTLLVITAPKSAAVETAAPEAPAPVGRREEGGTEGDADQ